MKLKVSFDSVQKHNSKKNKKMDLKEKVSNQRKPVNVPWLPHPGARLWKRQLQTEVEAFYLFICF